MRKQKSGSTSSAEGFSLIEMLIVVGVVIIIAAIALPQAASTRRLLRFTGLSREITAQLRLARQLAMSQRQVFRFRYDDLNKQLVIIDNEERGTPANPTANDPSNDKTVKTVDLASAGIPPEQIVYGRPDDAPDSLPDGTSESLLDGGQIEIIFQPDGSALDANGNPASTALFLYHSESPAETAIAISVLGAGGRVKTWRYSEHESVYVY